MEKAKRLNTAKRLSETLEKSNLTQNELAEKSGISKYLISKYMNGVNSPDSIRAKALGKILNVSPLWLMGFDDEILEQSETENTTELAELVKGMTTEQLDRVISYAKYILMEGKI